MAVLRREAQAAARCCSPSINCATPKRCATASRCSPTAGFAASARSTSCARRTGRPHGGAGGHLPCAHLNRIRQHRHGGPRAADPAAVREGAARDPRRPGAVDAAAAGMPARRLQLCFRRCRCTARRARRRLQSPVLATSLSPLDGVLVPTFGSFYVAVTLLFPFVAIRALGAEKESGALRLLVQLPYRPGDAHRRQAHGGAHGLVRLCAIPALSALLSWRLSGGHLSAAETSRLDLRTPALRRA